VIMVSMYVCNKHMYVRAFCGKTCFHIKSCIPAHALFVFVCARTRRQEDGSG
jgi:hypothetical protein